MGGALLTDLYELNMAASYLRRDMAGEAVFSLFVRELPPTRGFLVAAGLEEVLSFLEGFDFTDDDLAYLDTLGFDSDSLEAFRQLGTKDRGLREFLDSVQAGVDFIEIDRRRKQASPEKAKQSTIM